MLPKIILNPTCCITKKIYAPMINILLLLGQFDYSIKRSPGNKCSVQLLAFKIKCPETVVVG